MLRNTSLQNVLYMCTICSRSYLRNELRVVGQHRPYRLLWHWLQWQSGYSHSERFSPLHYFFSIKYHKLNHFNATGPRDGIPILLLFGKSRHPSSGWSVARQKTSCALNLSPPLNTTLKGHVTVTKWRTIFADPRTSSCLWLSFLHCSTMSKEFYHARKSLRTFTMAQMKQLVSKSPWE